VAWPGPEGRFQTLLAFFKKDAEETALQDAHEEEKNERERTPDVGAPTEECAGAAEERMQRVAIEMCTVLHASCFEERADLSQSENALRTEMATQAQTLRDGLLLGTTTGKKVLKLLKAPRKTALGRLMKTEYGEGSAGQRVRGMWLEVESDLE
jgi:hypothetical protein